MATFAFKYWCEGNIRERDKKLPAGFDFLKFTIFDPILEVVIIKDLCPNYVIIDFRLQTFETIRFEVIVIKNRIRLDCPPPPLDWLNERIRTEDKNYLEHFLCSYLIMAVNFCTILLTVANVNNTPRENSKFNVGRRYVHFDLCPYIQSI